MGTNYYARVLPKESDREKLISAIKNDNFEEIVKLANDLYGKADEYDITDNGVFHLGKRSYGWDFL